MPGPAEPKRDDAQHGAMVNWLASPQAYAHAPQSVEHVETHISHVFLAGDLVYKLKKPVRYDFLDFSTLAARERACRDEVRLNQRLASQIYRGVVPITIEADGSFCVSGRGEVIEWLVEMRRMAADRMLDAMHRAGGLEPRHIDELADLLAKFYAELPSIAMSEEAYRQRCLAHVQGNRTELLAVSHHLPLPAVQRVHSFQLQLLHWFPELFDQRVRAGRIVEGHGDLRAEHICFCEPIAIFDCIEFNQEFRQLDVADELAFLAAECDHIGAAWVGPCLLTRFQEASADHPPPVLIDFYKSYRAAVRAKVAALRCDQLAGPAKDEAANEAAAHLELADKYADAHLHPLILAVGGLSGTGKSTLAQRLSENFSAVLLRSDVIRQELLGKPVQGEAVDSGRYQPEARQRVYQEMFRQAAEHHQQRVSVVLDATFSSAEDLHAAHGLAADPRAMFLAIECDCRPEVARQRIVGRLQAGDDASEARPDVFENQRAAWQPWPALIPQIRIDTELPLDEQLQAVTSALSKIIKRG